MKLKTRSFEKEREYLVETHLGSTTAKYLGNYDLWHVFLVDSKINEIYVFMDDRWSIESKNSNREVFNSPTVLRYTPDTKKIPSFYIKDQIQHAPREIKSELVKILRGVGVKL